MTSQMGPAIHCNARNAGTYPVYLLHQPQGEAEVRPVYLSSLSLHAQRFPRTEADHLLEYETLRCIKQIFNSGVRLGVYCQTLLDFQVLALDRHTGCPDPQPLAYANRVFLEFASLGI